MNNISKFCSCKNINCKLHPLNHNKGCSPCISKNLRTKELPNCFFNLVKNSETRKDDSFKSFSKLLQEEEL
ncbi:MAG: hypothetical protein KHW62_05980 [Clostridiales bacterium]|nr:hypothetical protein [Clostridiales bacterium]